MNKLSLIVLASALAGAANASITFNVGTHVNGDYPGTGLTAKIEDTGLNTVKLTMTDGIPQANYVPTWLFNVDSSVGALTYSFVSGQSAQAITRSTDSLTGGNQIKGGKFDLQFSYAGSGNDRFVNGETSVYTISGLGLNSSSFLSLSANDVMNNGKNANVGNYYSVADVRFGTGKSGSVGATQAVPEPASMAALGLGAIGFLKRRKKA